MLERYDKKLGRLRLEARDARRARFYGIVITAAGLIVIVFQWL